EAALGCEPLAQFAELLDDGVDCQFARAAEEEARMDHDRCSATGSSKACRVVQHPDRHLMLATSALDVTHKAGERRVDREADRCSAGDLAQTPSEVPIHPEPIAEVDLARVEAALSQLLHRRRGALARG